jgi:hypothetical protein
MKTLALWISFGLIASTSRIINFDSDALGKTPAGWSVAMTNRGEAPRWEVRKDQTAPTQPYVLAQISNDATNNRCPLAIFNGLNLRDGDVSVRVKPVSGRADQSGGLVWRYRDPNNYYLARENARTKNVAIFKVENGQRTQIGTVPHDILSNTWSILKVSVRGNRFQVYVNHRRILQAEDKTFTGPGKVGLWTLADSVTYFDDFRVYPK